MYSNNIILTRLQQYMFKNENKKRTIPLCSIIVPVVRQPKPGRYLRVYGGHGDTKKLERGEA